MCKCRNAVRRASGESDEIRPDKSCRGTERQLQVVRRVLGVDRRPTTVLEVALTKPVTTGVAALLAALALAPAAAAAATTLGAAADSGVESALPDDEVGPDWPARPLMDVMPESLSVSTADGANADGSPATIPVALTVSAPGCSRVASLAAAQSEVRAGRDACLADGAYSGAVKLSTSAASRVTLSAEHPGGARISGLVTLDSHTAIDGLDLTSSAGDCVRISTAQTDIAVLNSMLHDCGRDGIRWARPALDGSNESSNVLVSGNVIRNVAWNSITVRGDAATVTSNELTGSTNDAVTLWGDGHVFRSNYIHDYSNTVGNHNDAFQTWGGDDDGFHGAPLTNLVIEANRIVNILGADAHGFMVSGENSDLTIRRNLWWNLGSHALNLRPGQTNVDALYNTFVHTGIVQYDSGTSGRIVGNVFSDVRPYYVTGCICRLGYNLAATWTPDETHGLQADPTFAGPSDFHLQATSAAVDSGDEATVPPTDIDGKPANGAPDRCAYER